MKKTLVILFVAGVLAACKSTDSNKSDYQYKDVPFTNVHFSDDFWALVLKPFVVLPCLLLFINVRKLIV